MAMATMEKDCMEIIHKFLKKQVRYNIRANKIKNYHFLII